MFCWSNWLSQNEEKTTTTENTRPVMARTSLVLSRMVGGRRSTFRDQLPGGYWHWSSHATLFFERSGSCSGTSVLAQLVVQSFEADPEDFGGAGFVVVGGFERLED